MRQTPVGMRANVGLVLALDPVSLAIVVGGAAIATGVMNYTASQKAADAQRSLRNQQQTELEAQARARVNAADKAAGTGATFGYQDGQASAAATGLGFGSGTAKTGLGRGQLIGQ